MAISAPPARLERTTNSLPRERVRRSRGWLTFEHDLAVLDVRLGNADARRACASTTRVRREAVIDHPLVHRPQQIRPLLCLERRLLAYLLLELR